MSLNRDSLVALFLILVSGSLMLASLDIREPDYGVLSPAAWPRLIIIILGGLSVVYLLQSIRMPKRLKMLRHESPLVSFFYIGEM